MGPADKARIGSFSTHIQIDPDDFTSDQTALSKILRNDLQERGPDAAVERGRYRASTSCCSSQGRRVVLVFTDGVDMPLNFSNGNKSLKDVMKRAEENDMMVYAIGLAGENGMPSGGRTVDRSGRGGFGNPGGFGGPAGAASAARAPAAWSWKSPMKGCRRLRRPPAAATSS